MKTVNARDSCGSSNQTRNSKLQKEDTENHTVYKDPRLKKEGKDENPQMDVQDSLQEPQEEGKHFKDLFIFYI